MRRVLLLLLALIAFSSVVRAYPIVNGTSSTGGSAITSLTPTQPSGALTGMAELAFVTINVQEAITAPSGWTVYDTVNYNTTWVSKAYWHCFAAGDPDPSWTFLIANGEAEITTYNDVNCSNPIDQHEITSSTTPTNLSTLTPSKANSDIAVLSADNSGGVGYPTGWLGLLNVNAAAGMVEGVGYFATGGTTATGTVAITSGGGAVVAAEMTILNPPTAGQAWSGIRAFTSGNASGNTANAAVPTNIQANDSVVCMVGANQSATITPPSGFNSIQAETGIGCFTSRFQSYCKTATGSESGNFGFVSSSTQISAMCATFWGAGCPPSPTGTVGPSSATSQTAPSVTTLVNDVQVFSGAFTCSSGPSASPNIPLFSAANAAGNFSTLANLTQQATAGATTGQTFSWSGSNSSAAQTLALPNTEPTPTPGGSQALYGAFP